MSKFITDFHEKVKHQIQAQVEKIAHSKNKGKRVRSFKEGDLVWLHLRKERFPNIRKSKLSPRGDGPFQVNKKINNNAYQLDLHAEYGVHPTFNITDLVPFIGIFDEEDNHQNLRANPLQGEGDDVTPTSPSLSASTSPSPHQGLITISMMRKIHMGLSQDDQVNRRLFTLFTWAKELSKI